jgi:hypothetical protein
MKQELLEIQKTQSWVLLNGWKEDIDYILTLHLPSLMRIEKGVYQSNPR